MLSWEHLYEFALNILERPRLKNLQQLQIFEAMRGSYTEVCNRLLNGAGGSNTTSEGYDWTKWAGSVRQTFRDGVPLGFLSDPTLSSTMVFARRRGVKQTNLMIKDVERVFGREVASILLLEDYIGLPTITNAAYLTSANRCHHSSHLARYSEICQKRFWDCASIIEWGGGYGNMARIIRRMNPSVTYTIIDLPELLALQYVYLVSVEGPDSVHIVQTEMPQIVPGKINLLSSQMATSQDAGFRCDSFISTWALTESPRDAQEFVNGNRFFGANNILLGSLLNENNYLAESIDDIKVSRIPVPASKGIGQGHEYWFK